jgi:DNA polymerase-1
MDPVVKGFDEQFPGVRAFQRLVDQRGRERLYRDGEAYVITPYGRRLAADDDKVYVLVNYLIQSHAAEYFKRKICELAALGFSDYMVLPVHDELVFDVPRDVVEEAKPMIEQTMSDLTSYAVPITASADVLEDNWGTKYRDEKPQEEVLT